MGKIWNVLNIKPGKKLLNLSYFFMLVVFVGKKTSTVWRKLTILFSFHPFWVLLLWLKPHWPLWLIFAASVMVTHPPKPLFISRVTLKVLIRLAVHCCAPAPQPPDLTSSETLQLWQPIWSVYLPTGQLCITIWYYLLSLSVWFLHQPGKKPQAQ